MSIDTTADRSPVNGRRVYSAEEFRALQAAAPAVRDVVAELDRRAQAAEALAAARLAKVLDLLDELARRDAAEPAPAAPFACYAVGFPGRPTDRGDTPPILTHTTATRERADRILGYARKGDPRCVVYAVHGPLADLPATDAGEGIAQ